MRVLLDECVPAPLASFLTDHDVATVQSMNWTASKNGELLALAEKEFEVFVTADQNLQYQQNLLNRRIAILLLPTNRWPALESKREIITTALGSIKPNEFKAVKF